MEDIKVVQDALELTHTYVLLRKEEELLKPFELVLEQEETL